MRKPNPDLTDLTFDEIESQYGEETAIDAGIAADPDTVEIDSDWLARARPTDEVLSEVLPGWRARGPQEASTTEAVNVGSAQTI